MDSGVFNLMAEFKKNSYAWTSMIYDIKMRSVAIFYESPDLLKQIEVALGQTKLRDWFA